MNETIMDGVWIINVGHEVGKSNPLYAILGILFGVLAAVLIFVIINAVGLSLDLDITNDINSMEKLLILLAIICGVTGGINRRNSFKTCQYRRYYLRCPHRRQCIVQ